MYHSIIFGDGSLYPSGHPKEGQFMGTNTWDDWHLIPGSRPTMAMPGVVTKFIEVPGRDGTIDLSEFLVKRPVYGDRSGSFQFYVDNDHEYWIAIYEKIASFLHGKKLKFVLEDDPNWFYEGRITMSGWASEKDYSQVTLNYQVGPYKTNIRKAGEDDMLWDTFNFDTDYDYYGLHSISLNPVVSKSIPIYDFGVAISPTLTLVSGQYVTADFGGVSQTISQIGQSKPLGSSTYGENFLTISGDGVAKVSFLERRL